MVARFAIFWCELQSWGPVQKLLLRSRWTICGVVVSFLLSPLTLGARSERFLPVNKPAQPDAIVILAGAFEHRSPKALALLRAGVAKRLIIDADDVQRVYGETSADRAIRIARTEVQLASRIDVCRMTADSTEEEALQLESCLRMVHAHSAMLVTSREHSRRAFRVFQHRLPQYEWSMAIADEQQGSTAQTTAWSGTQMQEWLKQLWWAGVDRWKSPTQTQAALMHVSL
jgi:uncharacterized SAM-binding protein YcdF (DUF218 family)